MVRRQNIPPWHDVFGMWEPPAGSSGWHFSSARSRYLRRRPRPCLRRRPAVREPAHDHDCRPARGLWRQPRAAGGSSLAPAPPRRSGPGEA